MQLQAEADDTEQQRLQEPSRGSTDIEADMVARYAAEHPEDPDEELQDVTDRIAPDEKTFI